MQWYIRSRGRVLGPFDEDKLRALAARGQFGKMHEVSQDGVIWNRAAQFPDLFRSEDRPIVTAQIAGAAEPSSGRVALVAVDRWMESRTWIHAFAAVCAVVAAATLIGGTLLLIEASKLSRRQGGLKSVLVAESVGCFIGCVVGCMIAVILITLAGMIREFADQRNEHDSRAILRKAKQAAACLCALIVIDTVLVLIFVVYEFAAD